MSCQGPVTQPYIRMAHQGWLLGRCPGSPLPTAQQAAKGKPTLFPEPKLCLEFTRSSLTFQIEHALWIPSLPRTGLEPPKRSGPKSKWETIKRNALSNSSSFLFSHLPPDHKLSPNIALHVSCHHDEGTVRRRSSPPLPLSTFVSPHNFRQDQGTL